MISILLLLCWLVMIFILIWGAQAEYSKKIRQNSKGRWKKLQEYRKIFNRLKALQKKLETLSGELNKFGENEPRKEISEKLENLSKDALKLKKQLCLRIGKLIYKNPKNKSKIDKA